MLRGSEIASLFLQPIPGSDTAVFLGIQKALLEGGAIDLPFLEVHTEGWQAVLQQIESTGWEAITSTCGLSREELGHAANLIAHSSGLVFAWAMGITHHANGVDNVQEIANTALLTGNAGRPGAGTMQIRGHSNVQGFGSMGVTVQLRADMQQALEQLLGRSLSHVPGYDIRALIEAAEAGKVDTLLCLGGNLWGANPDSEQARRALGRIHTILYLATKPNQGHFHGLAAKHTLVLPMFNRFETPHRTTTESGNNFVRLNEPGTTHLKQADLISEVEFLAELAGRRLAVTPLPELSLPGPDHFGGLAAGQSGLVLALITVRSYSQHNTVVCKPGESYRGMPHRQTILMNRADLRRAGLAAHQLVSVQGEAGVLENIEIIPGEIREGAVLMFYPKVNAIIRAPVDPRCGTPAYKRVPVLVRGA